MSLADRNRQVDLIEKRNRIEHLTEEDKNIIDFLKGKINATNRISILFSYKTKMSDQFTCVHSLISIEHTGIEYML